MVEWSKLTDIFNNFNKFQQQKILNCKDCHDQIWIDHFYHENFAILGMVMVKNWLDHFDHWTSILAKWSKIVVIGPPPPNYVIA
jgi:hypothetical protein